jgi:hypothetical protein
MDKYLQQILLEVNTIIIPGLGALTITNAKSGDTMFMPFLKHDDGKLTKHISEKEGMSENDAKNLIAKYVREINLKLDQGETYDMFQFGRFIKTKDGEIDFQSWNSYQNTQNNVVSQEIPTSEAKQESTNSSNDKVNEEKVVKEEIKQEPKPINEEEKKEVLTEEKNTTAETQNTNKKTPVKEEVKEKSTLSEVNEKQESKIEKKSDKKKETLENTYIPPSEIKKEIKPKKKKKGAVFWILIVLILLLGGGGVTVFIFQEQAKSYLPFLSKIFPDKEEKLIKNDVQEEEIIENQKVEENEVAIENTTVEEPKKQEVVEGKTPEKPQETGNNQSNKTSSIDGSKPFHVVVGAFSEVSNAENYAQQLVSFGKNNSFVLGKFNDLHFVVLNSYSSQTEANQASQAESNSWVFKYPK